jgi:glycosyltransferase involved in cell wall biosynthesis
MSPPLRISAIIPTYNRARFLGTAITSVLAQTSLPVELIVIDDGSTDNTEHIVRGFTGLIPIHYEWQQNQGKSIAVNRAAAMARGEWLAFLDSDDIWYAHKLEVEEAYITQHPDAVFVYSDEDRCWIDDADQRHPLTPWSADKDPLAKMIYNGAPNAQPSTVMIRTDQYRQFGGFDPALHIGEDKELFVRISCSHSLHYIPQRLSLHQFHSRQITRNPVIMAETYHRFYQRLASLWAGDRERLRILTDHTVREYASAFHHFLEAEGTESAESYLLRLQMLWGQDHAAWRKQTRWIGRLYSPKAKQALREGDFRRARKLCRESLTYDPWSLKTWRRFGFSFLPGLRSWWKYAPTLRGRFNEKQPPLARFIQP